MWEQKGLPFETEEQRTPRQMHSHSISLVRAYCTERATEHWAGLAVCSWSVLPVLKFERQVRLPFHCKQNEVYPVPPSRHFGTCQHSVTSPGLRLFMTGEVSERLMWRGGGDKSRIARLVNGWEGTIERWRGVEVKERR
jgi:hypothetical protein